MISFEDELTELINKHSMENKADMPDFLLSKLLCEIIEAIGPVVKKTLDWHNCDSITHPKRR